ncbi:MAG: hypothetical protein V7609_792 [Verrucomicrobiota bacterium]
MKPITLLVALILFNSLSSSNAALPIAKGRRITELNVVPTRVLQRSISPKFYKSLLVSPLQGWIAVRGNLTGTRLVGAQVVRSDLNGAWDAYAIKMANEIVISGYYSIERPNLGAPLLFHLFIYQIADGTMALSFAHFEEPGGDQMQYWGCARLAVLKKDGKRTEIEGPEGLQGKGWAVRQGMRNDIKATLKLEKLPGMKQ